MQLTVDVDDTGVLDTLRRIRDAGDDPRPALEEIADDFRATIARIFRRQGGSDGAARWKPLNDTYLRRRLAAGKGGKILQIASWRGGQLRDSVTEKDARDHVERVQRDEVRIGTRLGIAQIHQEGGTVTTRGSRSGGKPRTVTIPARPFVVVSRDTEQRWAAILQHHLTGTAPRGRGL